MTIHAQLACAQRELGKRKGIYPKWVRDGKLTQAKADEEIAGMTAIVGTLTKLKDLAEASEQMRGPISADTALEPAQNQELKQGKLI